MSLTKPRSFMGALAPWVWAVAPVYGCNLRCWHCPARLMPGSGSKEQTWMEEATWRAIFSTIRAVTPGTRVDVGVTGEPTLHPNILGLLRIAREISPRSQIQVTTNGTILTSGRLSVRDLLRAGANVVFIDVYGSVERHEALARESGARWYHYDDRPADTPSCWVYQGPDLQLVVLMKNPSEWPKERSAVGRMSTFLNHLDWPAAEKFGVVPVTTPPHRRCNQPFRYASTNYLGQYLLCCHDFTSETAGEEFGDVRSGKEGFLRFWFGRRMQEVRRTLRAGDRAAVSQCSRCRVIWGRNDVVWPDHWLRSYWDGGAWKLLSASDGSPAEGACALTAEE